jgi:hypothetical protein
MMMNILKGEGKGIFDWITIVGFMSDASSFV